MTRAPSIRRATAAVLALAIGGVLSLLGAVPAQAVGATAATLTIDGSGRVGDALAVRTVTPWDPAPDLVVYSWYRFDDGAVVHSGADAGGAVLTPTAAEVGTMLYVEARAFRDGSLMAVASTTGSPTIHLGSFSGVPDPTVSGSGVVGTDFTASLSTSGTTPTPTSVDYVWYRVDTGAVVQTGGSTLRATSSLVGTAVYAIATVRAPDTSPYTTSNSPFSSAVRLAEFAHVPAPSVTGTGIVGSTYTASLDVAGITPVPQTVAYTWHRADTGEVVQSGGSTFVAPSALLGTPVYVVATLSADGASPYTTTNSAFSSTVRLAEFDQVPVPAVSGSGMLGTTFTATLDVTGLTPVPVSVEYVWHRADTGAVVQASGSTFVPTAALVGTPVYVVATLRAPGTSPYTTPNSSFSSTVRLAEFSPGAPPVLVGQHTLGGTLVATLDTSAWTPRPESFDYQWYLEDGTPVEGETGAVLPMTEDLVGEVVYVLATAHAVDHQPYVVASAPSGRIARPDLALVGAPAGGVAAAVVGGTVDLSVAGLLFSTDYQVELHSTPVPLGTVTSTNEGTLSARFAIPSDTPTGRHHLVLLLDGVEAGRVPLDVTAAEVPSPEEPTPGTPTPGTPTPEVPQVPVPQVPVPVAPVALPAAPAAAPAAHLSGGSATSSPTLASTGADSSVLGLLATLVALTTGVAAVLASRARRAHR